MAMTEHKPGTVIEWWVSNTPKPGTQNSRVVTPVCSNAGQAERAGQCRCAPPPDPSAEPKPKRRRGKLDRLKEAELRRRVVANVQGHQRSSKVTR